MQVSIFFDGDEAGVAGEAGRRQRVGQVIDDQLFALKPGLQEPAGHLLGLRADFSRKGRCDLQSFLELGGRIEFDHDRFREMRREIRFFDLRQSKEDDLFGLNLGQCVPDIDRGTVPIDARDIAIGSKIRGPGIRVFNIRKFEETDVLG